MMTRRQFVAAALASGGIPTLAQPPAGARIRIAQLGTSHSHAAGKMEAVRSLPETFEVVGVSEPDDGKWNRVSNHPAFAGVPRLPEDELLHAEDLRALVVESDLDAATVAALRALRAGKHVHLDKPGAARHAAFQEMRTEAERRSLTVQMGYMLRYNPAFTLLFRAVREGWLGAITEIDASMGKLAPAPQRNALRDYPGAGMFELACHLVDAAVTILGKPAAVHAFQKQTQRPDDTLPDNQLAVLEYPNALVTLRCNHTDPNGFPRRRFFVAGTKGTMDIAPLESGKATVFLSEPHGDFTKGSHSIALKPPANRYADEFHDLARVIRGEKALAWNAAHDIAVHETALRAAGAWTE